MALRQEVKILRNKVLYIDSAPRTLDVLYLRFSIFVDWKYKHVRVIASSLFNVLSRLEAESFHLLCAFLCSNGAIFCSSPGNSKSRQMQYNVPQIQCVKLFEHSIFSDCNIPAKAYFSLLTPQTNSYSSRSVF